MSTIQETNQPAGEHSKPAPMLFAWLASAVTVALIVAAQFLPRGAHPYLRITGVFTLLIAGVFIFAPFYLLTKYGGTKAEDIYMQSRQVVDRGLYAITRHPQYLGYILLASGFALLSQHWATLLLAVISTTCFYVQVMLEKQYCLAQFGEPYALYLRRVPRFNLLLGILRILRGISCGCPKESP